MMLRQEQKEKRQFCRQYFFSKEDSSSFRFIRLKQNMNEMQVCIYG